MRAGLGFLVGVRGGGEFGTRLDLGIVGNCSLAGLGGRKSDAPDSELVLRHLVCGPIPCVYESELAWSLVGLRRVKHVLKSPIKDASTALGAHSRYVIELSGPTFRPNFS